jgi:hypothetical protein
MASRRRSPFDQLNTSVSKMMYTFSKAERFESPTKRLKYCHSLHSDKYYNLPPLFGEGRKTSLGYGKKSDIAGRVDLPCPSPTKYDLSAIYDLKKKDGIKFGYGREVNRWRNVGT